MDSLPRLKLITNFLESESQDYMLNNNSFGKEWCGCIIPLHDSFNLIVQTQDIQESNHFANTRLVKTNENSWLTHTHVGYTSDNEVKKFEKKIDLFNHITQLHDLFDSFK
jgi:hypothetical protein